MIDALGYLATVVFIASYFFKQPSSLRRIQAVAASLWAVYGAMIHAMPVIVANLLVAGIAVWSSVKVASKSAPSV